MRKKEKKYIASDRKLLKSISTTTKESLRLSAVAVITIIISGCWGSSKTDHTLLKELEEGIVSSNNIISLNNEDVYRYFETALQDNSVGIKAAIWQPKALLVKNTLT